MLLSKTFKNHQIQRKPSLCGGRGNAAVCISPRTLSDIITWRVREQRRNPYNARQFVCVACAQKQAATVFRLRLGSVAPTLLARVCNLYGERSSDGETWK